MTEHKYPRKAQYRYDVTKLIEKYMISKGFHTYSYSTDSNEVHIHGDLKSQAAKITKCNIHVTVTTDEKNYWLTQILLSAQKFFGFMWVMK